MAEKKEAEKDLTAGEKAILEQEKRLAELQKYLEERETALDAREKALADKGPSVSPAADKKKPLTKEQEKLIEDACKAYGIDKKYLFSSGIDPRTKEAILLTAGGKKVRYSKDMEVAPLDPVAVDGVSRKKPRYVMGKKK